MKNCIKILDLMLFIEKTLSGQDTCSISQLQLPKEYLTIVTKKMIAFEEKLEKNTDKALRKLLKQEQKIRKKLNTIDSSAASEIFGDVKNLYESIQKDSNSSVKFGSYIPRIDTLVNTYNFLQRNPQVILQMKDADNKLKSALSKIGALNRQLNKAENLRQFLRERRQYLKEQLSKFGFGKE